MLKYLNILAALVLSATPLMAQSKYGLGRPALPQEVAAWDHDVRPGGIGLPPGSGDVLTGETAFADKCAACHGDFAEGVGNWPKLAGGDGTLADKDPVKTVGSYWPYLSTVWDYVNRSMPFGNAQTVTPDEVYAIVAYILYSNYLVDEDFTLSNENFADVEMLNASGFIMDDRDQAEYAIWRGEPCMSGCKDKVEITMRATVLDVTPDTPSDTTVIEVAATDTPEEAPGTMPEVAAIDPELVAAGAKVYKKCAACHKIGAGAKNGSGPQLNGIIGRLMGSADGFKYSKGFNAAAQEGRHWDDETLGAFLTKPRDFMKGTKMSFGGLKKSEDINAILAYLQSASE